MEPIIKHLEKPDMKLAVGDRSIWIRECEDKQWALIHTNDRQLKRIFLDLTTDGDNADALIILTEEEPEMDDSVMIVKADRKKVSFEIPLSQTPIIGVSIYDEYTEEGAGK